jgi:heparin binding hemagglutinin HbhA
MTRSTNLTRSLDAKPVYAAAGAGDLAVEKLRQFSDRLTDVNRQEVQSTVETRVAAVQKDVEARLVVLQDAVKDLPEQAQLLASSLVARAAGTYEDLANRGEAVVGRIRRQQATQELEQQAASTVRRAKAPRTTVGNSAAVTKRSAKATVTSASETASAAARAAEDAADEIG